MNLPDVADAYRAYVHDAISEIDPSKPGRSIMYHGQLPDDCCDDDGTLGVSWAALDASVQFPLKATIAAQGRLAGAFQLVDLAARYARCWYVPEDKDLGSAETFARYNGDAALLALIAEHVDLRLLELSCGQASLGDGTICHDVRWTSTRPDISGDCAGVTWHLIAGLVGDVTIESPSVAPSLPAGAWAHYDATVGVTDAGGGKVSAWADQSGNGRNLTQGFAGHRPDTGIRQINGLNVVDFTTDYATAWAFMQTAAQTLAQPITTLLVAQFDNMARGGNETIFTFGGGGPQLTHDTVGWFQYAGGGNVNYGTEDTNPHLFTNVTNGPASQHRVDGVQLSTGNPGTGGMTSEDLFVGAYGGVAGFSADAAVAEMLVYPRVLTPTEIAQAESYLTDKWGI